MECIVSYRFRPSARLLRTIGQDLVKDSFAAVVELVKNAYDADSDIAHIRIKFDSEKKTLITEIRDQGTGMDLDIIESKWLVPATSDKLDRKHSPSGRSLQGRKGIGRFAAATLGDLIFLESSVAGMRQVNLILNLEDFSDDQFLEDIEIDIDEGIIAEQSGTKIEIVKIDVDKDKVWSEKEKSQLFIELSKLLAPAEVASSAQDLGYNDDSIEFKITVQFIGFENYSEEVIEVKPFGIVEHYDYRIFGKISNNGYTEYTYSNQNTDRLAPESGNFQIFFDEDEPKRHPGRVLFDLRVFDRDPDSIEELINRGLKDPFSGAKVGKNEARKILDAYYGVSLFRGKFRIRPYGDSDVDWLELDSKRVQKMSRRVGHNQIIGFISIQPEEESKLEEKSARDGLVENAFYLGLKDSITLLLNQLEQRRFAYRKLTGKGGRKRSSVNNQIEDLFDFAEVIPKLDNWLRNQNVDQNLRTSITKTITKELESVKKDKRKKYTQVKETIALYQGQATLGRMTTILLHEGRKHLRAIGDAPNYIKRGLNKWLEDQNEKTKSLLFQDLEQISTSSKAISSLFKRIEPLSITRAPNRKQMKIKPLIKKAIRIFDEDLKRSSVSITLDIDANTDAYVTSEEIVTIFTNLIDNSLYWLNSSKTNNKEITITASHTTKSVEIIFIDNGPGFQIDDLENIFEAGVTGKVNGTGLGLAIIGETVERLGGQVSAVKNSEGAEFILEFKRELNNGN